MLPPTPDFDLGDAEAAAASTIDSSESSPGRSGGKAGWLAPLAIAALKWKSLFALFKLGKLATTFGTMFLSIGAYATIWGWKFAVGFVICIFIHEMGHVVVNWSKGLKQSAPMFIPFVGAVIFIKQFPDDPTIQSESGAGGPAAGMLAALVCWLIGHWTGSSYWYALANVGFLINLFNLFPFPPLDGSHISTVFSPRVWDAALITLLLVALKLPIPMLWGVLVVGFLFRLGRGNDTRHLQAMPATRVRMAILYVFLCVVLAYGTERTMFARSPYSGARSERSSAPARVASSTEQPSTDSIGSQGNQNPSEEPTEMTEFRRKYGSLLRTVVVGGGLAAFTLFWSLTAYLLASAARRRFQVGSFGLVMAMAGGLGLGYSISLIIPILHAHFVPLLGAYCVGSSSALFYAGYQAYHLRLIRARPSLALLTARAMAWTAFGALIVAYAVEDLAIVGLVLCSVALYLALNRWLVFAQLASLAEKMGRPDRALQWLDRAFAVPIDPDTRSALLQHVARLNILLARGGVALEAMDSRSNGAGPTGKPAASSIAELTMRGSALILLERYDDALSSCEGILQSSSTDPLYSGRLLLVHIRLAELARLRGWSDEAVAQADWSLRALPKAARNMTSRMRILRAAALVEEERFEEARAECEMAVKESRESAVEAGAATVLASLHLRANDPTMAIQEAERALRLLPGHLESLFQYGLALCATNTETQKQEGHRILHTLANDFRHEHWGKRAQAVLTT